MTFVTQNSDTTTFDFNSIRERLETARARLSGELGQDEVRALLEERSRRLALRDAEEVAEGEFFGDYIVVRRGELLIGLPVNAVDEIRRVVVSVLPHANRILQGLFQIRGQAYCLADVLSLLAAEERPQSPQEALVALVEGPQGPLGLRIDEVVAPRTFFAHDVNTDIKTHASNCVQALTRDLVHLIDVGALLATADVRMGAARMDGARPAAVEESSSP